MQHRPPFPFSYIEDEYSPDLGAEAGGIRFVLRDLAYDGEHVGFKIHLSFLLPTPVAARYRRPEEGIVLVVHDIDQRAGFAQRTQNDFMHVHYPPGTHLSPNCIGEPPLPLPGRGDPNADSLRGGYVSGGLGFTSPRPVLRPSVHVYAVFENFISNRFALDLIGLTAVDLG